MEITLEQVERLREKADVSYAQAKQALEYSGGNLLDALIYLEEQGAIPRPQGAYYSTRNETPPPSPVQTPVPAEQPKAKKRHSRGGLRRLCQKIRRVLLENELEIWRKGQPVTSLPILILVLLVLFAFYFTVPALILGLFLGFRYQISGPDLEDEAFNGMMGNVADTAADLGRQVMEELKKQHEKYNNREK